MLSIRLQRDKELTLKTIYVVLLCESRSHGPSFVWVLTSKTSYRVFFVKGSSQSAVGGVR